MAGRATGSQGFSVSCANGVERVESVIGCGLQVAAHAAPAGEDEALPAPRALRRRPGVLPLIGIRVP